VRNKGKTRGSFLWAATTAAPIQKVMINPLIAPSLFLVLRQWPQAHLGHFSIRLTSYHAVIARLDRAIQ